MKNRLNNLRALAVRNAVKLGAIASGTMLSVAAHAQTSTGGIDAMLDAVDLSGIATKVGAAGLLIVGIALVFKGPALAKRIINRV